MKDLSAERLMNEVLRVCFPLEPSEFTDTASLRSKLHQTLQVAVLYNPTFSKKTDFYSFMNFEVSLMAVFSSEHVLPCDVPATAKCSFSWIYLAERSLQG